MKWLLKLYSDKFLISRYKKTGLRLGNIESQLYVGYCPWHKPLQRKMRDLEAEYVRRGYRAVPDSEFDRVGGCGVNIWYLFGVKRGPAEEPVYYYETLC